MTVYDHILQVITSRKACFTVLIDPDKIHDETIPRLTDHCQRAGVDCLFVGGSLLMQPDFEQKIGLIKEHAGNMPVILFPGGLSQISARADALLFLSLLSGRNPDHIIGTQVAAAPLIRRLNIETIATAYLLIDSGARTSVEFISGTSPIPSNKPDIVIAHCLAAEMLGFKLIYLEAGSGAKYSVPGELVQDVCKEIQIPVIVGGGIRTPQDAEQKVKSGASIIVIGNHFEDTENHTIIKDFAHAIHGS